MLSRKTRQQVVELLETVDAGLVRFSSATEKAAMLEDCIAAFSAAQDICHEALSTARLAFYRETLDTLSAALEQLPVAGDSADIASLCHSLLGWLLDALREEPVKKEIVFLPYKASMWDSLESIWQAAVNDAEHCNAYVIPIPYADLTPEHTAKEWHVEKELFPDYVPVIDFRSVDLEKLHPDVIFIHNPYDDCNYVTSVDSRYYSRELKKYTDCLVYVPYYVSQETNQAEALAACIATPAALNVDLIIVQSENMRQMYIDVLLNRTNMKERHYWEARILGLGSPKFDKVRSGIKADFPLPPAWKKKIEGRKVLLYNTSLDSLLLHPDKIGAKLRWLFDFFRPREEVAFWWRPHPLTKAILGSMRPEIEEEYRTLEQAYIEAGWGIYDEGADFYPAVFWSDAYYGDASSVLYLYQETGKSMMLQDAAMLPTYRPYWMFDIYWDERGGKLWFQPPVTNAIMSMEISTGTLCLEYQFVSESFVSDRVWGYSLIRSVGDTLIFVPFMEKQFLAYDRKTGRSYLTALPAVEGFAYTPFPCLYGATFHDGSLFCFGRFPAIVEYRVESREIFYHTGQNGGLSELLQDAFYYHNPYVEHEGRLWFVLTKNSLVVSFDYDSKNWQTYEVGASENRYLYIATDGVSLWLYSLSGSLVEWRPDTGECHSYALPQGFHGHYFVGMVCTGTSVLLFPNGDEMAAVQMIAMDVETKAMRIFSAGDRGDAHYLWAKSMPGGHALAYEPYRGEFHEYDEAGHLYTTYPMRVESALATLWCTSLMGARETILQEHTMMELETFVNEVCAVPRRESLRRGGEQETSGEKIMDYILSWRGKK